MRSFMIAIDYNDIKTLLATSSLTVRITRDKTTVVCVVDEYGARTVVVKISPALRSWAMRCKSRCSDQNPN